MVFIILIGGFLLIKYCFELLICLFIEVFGNWAGFEEFIVSMYLSLGEIHYYVSTDVALPESEAVKIATDELVQAYITFMKNHLIYHDTLIKEIEGQYKNAALVESVFYISSRDLDLINLLIKEILPTLNTVCPTNIGNDFVVSNAKVLELIVNLDKFYQDVLPLDMNKKLIIDGEQAVIFYQNEFYLLDLIRECVLIKNELALVLFNNCSNLTEEQIKIIDLSRQRIDVALDEVINFLQGIHLLNEAVFDFYSVAGTKAIVDFELIKDQIMELLGVDIFKHNILDRTFWIYFDLMQDRYDAIGHMRQQFFDESFFYKGTDIDASCAWKFQKARVDLMNAWNAGEIVSNPSFKVGAVKK